MWLSPSPLSVHNLSQKLLASGCACACQYNAGLPVFLGEYGLAYCTMDDVNALIQLAAQDHIGWAAWIFEADGNPALITTSMTPTDPYGTAVYQAMLTTPPIPR